MKKHPKKELLLTYQGHEFYDRDGISVLHVFKNENGEMVKEGWDFETYHHFLLEHGLIGSHGNGGLYA